MQSFFSFLFFSSMEYLVGNKEAYQVNRLWAKWSDGRQWGGKKSVEQDRERVVKLTKLKGGPLKRSIIKLINFQPPELSKKGKI